MSFSIHKHRLVPGHVGGEYVPSNVLKVNTAMHAFLHKMLWLDHGRWQDRVAWQVLSGAIRKEDARVAAVSAAGRRRWQADPDYRERVTAAQKTPRALEKRSASLAKRWADPVFRERMLKSREGKRWTAEAKAVASKRMRGNAHGLGYRHTDSARARIGDASRGNQWAKGHSHPQTAETRALISAGHRRRAEQVTSIG